MKKTVLAVGVLLLSLGFTSCDDDDIEDVACETAEGTLETAVEQTYAAYDDDREDADKCQAAKDAIEEYRDLECTEETAYAVEYADVLLNCPD